MLAKETRQAVFHIGALQESVKEAGAEAVTCSNRIDHLDGRRGETPLSVSCLTKSRLRAALHDYHLGQPRQDLRRLRQIIRPYQLLGLALVGEEEIHILQNLQHIFVPLVVGIVIGIE